MNYLMKAKNYHGYEDAELVYWPGRVVVTETKETKYFVVQERDLSYRITPHFHPYTGRLMQALLRKSTSGLQAVDTEYAPGNASLPQSVEIALSAGASVSLPAGAKLSLVNNVQATVAGEPPIALTAEMQVRTVAVTATTSTTGVQATLVEGMVDTPPVGDQFTLPAGSQAFLKGETRATLAAETAVVLFNGRQATIPAGTEVVVDRLVTLTFPGTPPVRLVKRVRRPRDLYAPIFTALRYNPSSRVERPHPVRDLDFTTSGAYAVYNWELFFHVPMTIAIHLSKNQRFADAQRWFHYVFDPTDSSDEPTPERFWKVRPFQSTDVRKIEDVLVNLVTGADEALRVDTINSIKAWQSAPFRPHVVARYRQQSYMYKAVMAYLDNLIAWGDSLFRQDSGEAIDEALMLYVLAANILGPRPQPVPRKGAVRAQHYDNLRKDLRQFGTVVRDIEADVPMDLMPFPSDAEGTGDRLATVRSLGKALYFAVPRNDKLLSYWDTVADRLFKIRNSLNIQGVLRQLALFEPPIDPAMLARAAAAGLDVSAIINGLNQPLPLVRSQLLLQKATEIVQEVKSLGNNLLSVMEREDGEALALLRAKHERVIMAMGEQIKYAQVQEAIKAKEALLTSLTSAVQRYAFFERQLGKKADEIEKSIPQLGELDSASLEKMKFSMREPAMGLRAIDIDIADDAFAAAAGAFSGGHVLSSHEVRESLFLEGAQLASDVANILNTLSSAIHVIPTVKIHGQPMGCGGTVETGGTHFGWGIGATANAANAVAERLNFEARRAARIQAFAQRERDWAYQSNVVASEITQIFKQLRAAQIREAIAERELATHRQTMKHAVEIETFLNGEGVEKNGKKTNKSLYAFLKREVKGLYAQAFQFAFDIARKAERGMQHELGRPDLTFLQFGYLAGKEGLLAGEKLFMDVKRMELAYLEMNQREYELTKHASLLQLDPLALVRLRTTGRCTFTVPEAAFDMDAPGHYFRRIKTVALSIPSVTGPFTSVNCTLTLLKSSVRKSPVLRDGVYAREDAEDDRFNDYFGSLQSIVTSSAQNDPGMFEPNLRDERYLPFEFSGAISEWQLELPANPSKGEPQQFDYNTISDVILHMRYTARQGGGLLRKKSLATIDELTDAAQASGSVRLFSVRQEFSTEWARLQSQTPAANQRFALSLKLTDAHFPFWSQGRLRSVASVDVLARSSRSPVPASIDIFERLEKTDADGTPVATKKDTLVKDPAMGNLLVGRFTGGATGLVIPATPVAEIKLFLEDRTLSDLWVAVRWSSAEA